MTFLLKPSYKEKYWRVFDRKKAKKIMKDRKIVKAVCGLDEDWDYTSDIIRITPGGYLKVGKYFLNHSYWATPVIRIYNNGSWETIECWKLQKIPEDEK